MDRVIPYCGEGPVPAQLPARWNLDPWVLGVLAIAAAWLALRRGRSTVQSTAGWAAIAVLAINFVSPLCALSSALFSARVLHHALLVVAAAPLIAWAPRRPAAAPLGLLAASLAHVALFWIWHSPPAYGAALSSDLLYWVMQVSLLGSAVLFWMAVRQSASLAAAGALLGVMMATGLLGALLTFAGRPLYAPHLATTAAWGLSPLEDQQLAGLIMWAPMALAYLGVALALVGRTLASSSQARAGA
ncbi:cytochrome c oxidase assembly protein [Phenylobacterium deserti]|uniref:Cytochrome c oxidase assembly protein n=1 Tax=Phenylobacterium deserti TaxID=1914756 RepID=A0A328A9F5_9CAUL|nr:cytochrome c oxidase assembly protein [Phenylobacterium deserti]RAK51323.1 cytochrome c oxidase assembly protein [Phenylobacterium deserti]